MNSERLNLYVVSDSYEEAKNVYILALMHMPYTKSGSLYINNRHIYSNDYTLTIVIDGYYQYTFIDKNYLSYYSGSDNVDYIEAEDFFNELDQFEGFDCDTL